MARELEIGVILRWADAHYRRTGRWPTSASGKIRGAPGDTWKKINTALKHGYRGLNGRNSLSRLLALHRGKKPRARKSELNEALIWKWARAHKRANGSWPGPRDESVGGQPGENWRSIDLCLRQGHRGLPGGDRLLLLVERRSGRPAGVRKEPLDVPRILRWARAHRRRTGELPRLTSGAVQESPCDSWRAIDGALRSGWRGLPGGQSLSRVLSEAL